MNWADKRMSASARPFDERRCALFAFVLAEVSNSHQRDLQSVIGVCFLVAAGRELPQLASRMCFCNEKLTISVNRSTTRKSKGAPARRAVLGAAWSSEAGAIASPALCGAWHQNDLNHEW
jgi:hypothetical protein